MSILDNNLEALKVIRNNLYEGITKDKYISKRDIYVGDALNGDTFLALEEDSRIIPLRSIYSPEHEAERYVEQFMHKSDDFTLVIYGFGDGRIIRKILEDGCPVFRCIVYEPSIDIFMKTITEYDLSDVFTNDACLVMLPEINGDEFEKLLYDIMNYDNWRRFELVALSKYKELFTDEYKLVKGIYDRILDDKRAEMNTLIHFAEAGMKNEIKSLKWMINCKTLDAFYGKIPDNVPCIMVAAGPSLEKNIDEIARAKGKAFIICVDTAVKYMLNHNIMPDMICTIDPQKGPKYFENVCVEDVPIALSTDSDYRTIEAIGNVKPVYFSTTNDYYKELFRRQKSEVDYFDGGGSVGTTCFQIAVCLGFKTIILVGQDLAFTDDKAHAGMGMVNEGDFLYNLLMVDGYYGERVLTRGDFKHYIDWYNIMIPQIENQTIINSTEGGAKLKGAIQMPLREAIDTYCSEEWDFSKVYETVSSVWSSYEEKQGFYQEIGKRYKYFLGFEKKLKLGIEDTKRAITILKRGDYQNKELKKIDKNLAGITKEVSEKDGMLILIKRMIDTDLNLAEDLDETEEDLGLESIRLYSKMKKYLQDLLQALEELLPWWKEVLQEINDEFHFE